MKTFKIFFLLICLSSFSTFSQSYYVYEENFDGSSNWPEGNTEFTELSVYNNRYYFEHKRTEKSWQVITSEFDLDSSKDFEIETKIKKISGSANSGITFKYDYKDADNYKELGIATNGYFRVAQSVNGTYSNLKAWTKSDKVITGNYSTNILSISKKGNTVSFYVNDFYVYSTTHKAFVGKKMAIALYKNQKISIDYIRAKSSGTKKKVVTKNTKTILFEGFNNNNNNWAIADDADRTFQVKDGDYHIHHKRDHKGWSTSIEKEIDTKRDFKIAAQIKKVSGITNNGYGIMFGRLNNDNQNQFFISADGSYNIKKIKNGVTTYPKNWTKSSYIKKGQGVYNYLEVRQKSGNLEYYINSNLVFTEYNPEYFGKRVGFIVYKNQKIQIGYLSIAYLKNDGNNNYKKDENFTEVLTENFSNNSNDWSLTNSESVALSISNGKYYLNHKRDEKGWLTNLNKSFDTKKDFEIETKLEHISGDKNSPFGLTWGKEGTNYFNFLITDTGYYKITRTVNNKNEDIIKWVKTSSIKDSANILKLKKEDDSYKFYINGTFLTKIDFEPFNGSYLGFAIYYKQKVAVDYLKIKTKTSTKLNPIKKSTILTAPLVDNFNNNNSNWNLDDATDYEVDLKNGQLLLSRKTKGGIFISRELDLNTSKDFILETAINEKNTSDGWYGITFGRKNSANEFSFLLSGNGSYKYRKFDNDEYKEIIPLTFSSAIKQGENIPNKIKIVKSGSLLRFYINDQYVNETPFESFFGNKIGYTIYFDRKIAVDYLKVDYQSLSYNNPPIVTISEPNVELKRGFKIVQTKRILVKGQASDSDGIYEITVNGVEANVQENGSFVANVPLKYGKNNLIVKATDLKQASSTKTFVIKRSSPNIDQDVITDNTTNKDLDIGFGKYYALIIGVSDYTDTTIQGLKGEPTKDAQALADVLTSKYSFAKENVTVLKNPTENQINREFIKLSRKVGSNDNLVIFYAGHGNYDKTTEKGYWMPSNANMEFEENIILNTSIVTYIKAIPSKHTLLISDACFSGSILTTSRSYKTASKAVQKKYELPSRKAITSGTLTTVPNESVFMKYLLKRLNQNTQKYLSAGQLFNMIEDPVINNTTGDNQPQYAPISRTGDEGGDFIFIKRI
jgi:hypothetical protein